MLIINFFYQIMGLPRHIWAYLCRHLILADIIRHKDDPIFTIVDLRIRITLLQTSGKYLYACQDWMWPSDGERDTPKYWGLRLDLQSIAEPQNRDYSTWNGITVLETIEHEVAEPKGISSQVQEEQERIERIGVWKALSSLAAKPYRLCVHSND